MTDTTLALTDEQRRLEECVLEPIRTPGTVQSHGALIALDSLSLRIVHASESCDVILGVPAADVLGVAVDEILGAEWTSEHRDALHGRAPVRNPIPLTLAGQRLDTIIHKVGSLTIVEFEPSIAADDYRSTPSVYSAVHELAKATTNTELWAAAARELRQLTLFDRVMIYHFHPDGHGEIVAEEVAADMEPYMGLHYPASDIPAQARALYVTKLSRMIVNSSSEPSALLTDPAFAIGGVTALDLSRAELRSVSPHHLQFMSNMGQASTLSLSLIRGDQLIGMITLAHRTPRRVPFELRQGLEILAAQIAVQLGSMIEIERLTQQMQLRSVRTQLVSQVGGNRSTDRADIAAALLAEDLTLLDLIPAVGVMLYLAPHANSIGTTPGVDAVVLAAELISRTTPGVFVTETLSLDHPEIGLLLPGVTGLLLVPLTGGSGFMAWFRPEISETVNWLGDQTAANRLTPLSPRSSFASWTQSVTGRSVPWAGLQSEAEELARDLAGAMLRQAEAQLAALALHDPLTGLPNRRLLMDRIEHSLAGNSNGTPITLMFIDIDAFKSINDTHGHDAGDAVLVHVAKQIRATTRTQDTVARLGGDEFVVLCEGATLDEVAEIATRIVDAIRQPAYASGTMIAVTASVGIASADSALDAASLLRAADGAMYRAKAGGRDQTSR